MIATTDNSEIHATDLNPRSPASPPPVLGINAIEAAIGGSRILRGVTLDIHPGEVVCLMGRNGVGKTTTLRCIMGLLPVRAGTITFGGTPLRNSQRTDNRARSGLGYVPQGRDIFPHLTIEENLRIGLAVHGRLGSAGQPDLDRVYSLFPVLKTMSSRKGGVLSGGQQQQLAIARALLTRPKLLILDEPTEGIQPSIIDEIGDTLKKLKGELSILLVEQYVDFCRDVADRFYAMDRGAITYTGPISALTDDVVQQHLQV
ncbi:urea ABC transporter ATP-binding subunit UrtE [Geminisphaera colitermitum]|uniref:urea ABC transporter ATP-binding subunit UrtE n=1 Tax=Geminisphaera colitermitum TaxID=1148786 RepID=UPI000158C8E2|nr:urea ABC transporter ATP-binding subunit UrtE [Geminisphaera colitermitum]